MLGSWRRRGWVCYEIVASFTGHRFNAYALVGVIGTLLHWLVFFVLLQTRVSAVVATTVGAIVGALCNYALNYYYVFALQDGFYARLGRFFTIAVIGMLINAMIVYCLHTYHVWLAQLTATLVVLASGYWLNSRWTFAASAKSQ